MPSTIELDALQDLLLVGGAALVEALPVRHFEAGHMPGALNLPGVPDARSAAALVPDRGRTVVVYCSGPACSRSSAVAAAFERLGYTDVRVFGGGKAEWDAAGLALTQGEPVGAGVLRQTSPP